MEFRGIARINGEPSFSLYDPTNQRSYWLRLNQPDSGFTVTEYKPREDAVVVRHEGQARTISLHEARVQAMATPPPTPPGGVTPGTEQAQATTPEARMQDLAEEIRRRREIRRALVEGTQQPPAQDAPVPPDGIPPIPQ